MGNKLATHPVSCSKNNTMSIFSYFPNKLGKEGVLRARCENFAQCVCATC